MGRYYSGDIEGKFWVAIQPSDDAEQFGAFESSVVSYEVDDNDECRERLQELFAELGIPENFELTEDEVDALADKDADQSHERQHLYASLDLGLKIYRCVEQQGYCCFEAEC